MTVHPRGAQRGAAALVAALLLGGCASASEHDRTGQDGCGPPVLSQVSGRAPAGTRVLDSFGNDAALCEAWWLGRLDRGFVAQGIALDRGTVWVSGWRWSPAADARVCQVQQVSLRTGRMLRFTGLVEGRVGDRRPTYCRHGGGIHRDRHGLWLTETDRLWLLDPDRVGHRDQVRRVWSTGGVRASVSVLRRAAGGPRVGFGEFRQDRPAPVRWFRVADLLRPGVISLDDVAEVRRTRVPERLQGLTVGRAAGRRGTWLVQSTSRCGVLTTPRGRRVEVTPGAEDVEVRGRWLWLVSESAAKPYQRRGGRPVVPVLGRYDARALVRGEPPRCDAGW